MTVIRHSIRTLIAALAGLTLALNAAAQSLIRDAEIETTLREWSNPIFEAAGLTPDDVKLFIINDPSINAFVANGQHVHINSGLIIKADSPGQIKGVIAHETCHIACGHSVTRQRAAQTAMRPALVSIGLGILAIAAGEGGAGAALIGSSQKFAALNFFIHTRAEEATADAAAVEYLTSIGESPAGLVEFFENFRYQEVMSDSRREPFFRAHPLAADRIRAVRQLAEDSGMMDVPASERSLKQYRRMRAKLIGFLETPNKVSREYPQSDQSIPARYARAIAALRVSDIQLALTETESLIKDEPDNPYFYELKGQILFESGHAAESVAPHQRSNDLLPGNTLLLVNLARSLNARAAPGDLKKAENALRDALIADPENGFAWAQLAITLDKQDRRPEAQLATAEAAYSVGDIVRANMFAGRAIQDLPKGTPVYRRADDILLITDPSNPDNRRAWRRTRDGQRIGFYTAR